MLCACIQARNAARALSAVNPWWVGGEVLRLRLRGIKSPGVNKIMLGLNRILVKGKLRRFSWYYSASAPQGSPSVCPLKISDAKRLIENPAPILTLTAFPRTRKKSA